MIASSPSSTSLSMPSFLHRTAFTDVEYQSDSLRWSPPASTSCIDDMKPASRTLPSSPPSTRQTASVNPTLEIDKEISATQNRLRQSPHNVWFVVAYSSQGQQLPASPPTSAHTSPQIGNGEWTTRSNATTSLAFRLQVTARSSSTKSYARPEDLDGFMGDLRSALDAGQVHWAVAKFDERILCVQVFDGNVSGLRRARALVHGRALLTFLTSHDGPKSLLQVTEVAQLTPSWLLSKLATSPPPPPPPPSHSDHHQQQEDMPPRWKRRAPIPSELIAAESDGIPWESSPHAATLDSPASPPPPSVPSKEEVAGPIRGFIPSLGPLDGSASPRDVRKRNPLEDLRDLHERWSKSSSSVKSDHELGSEENQDQGNRVNKRKHKQKGAPSLWSRSKSSSSLASAYHRTSPENSRRSRNVSEQSSIPSRPPLLPLLSGDTTRTSSTSIGTLSTAPTDCNETWDGSRTMDREKYQSTYSSSAGTRFSGTSSSWRAQPDFRMVDDVLNAMRKSSIVHPIDGTLPTVIESGQSSRYERVGTAGSWYTGEASSRRGSAGTMTEGDLSISGHHFDWRALPAPPLPNTPMVNPHKALPELDEEKSEFLRFQEAERKRIEELERAEKRRREKARQKKDDEMRNVVMTKLINEQSQDRVRRGSDAGSLMASLAPSTATDAPASSASSLKGSKKGRPRAASTASASSGRRRSKTNENLPLAPPPRIPLPIPTTTKPSTEALLVPAALQTAPRTRSPLSNLEPEIPSGGTAGTPHDQRARRGSAHRPPSSCIESTRPVRRSRSKTAGNHDSATSETSRRSPHSSICTESFADSEALFDPKLTNELTRSFSKRHRHDMSLASVPVTTMDGDDSSWSSIRAQHYRALSESRKAKRRLEEQGLELSSWIAKLSESKIKPIEMSKEEMEQVRAQPRPHHRPHPVFTNTSDTSHAASQQTQDNSPSIGKDLPCPPPLSPHIPPKDLEVDTEEDKVSEARRRALAAQSAAEEQIRVARELQQRLEFELSEVLRRGRERNDAENAARAKWARDQAQRNLLDAFERSVLESEERKRRQYVDKIRKMEADQAEKVAQEKFKADQAEREAIAEHKRRRDDLARRDQKLQEEAQSHRAEVEKREERIRAEKAAKEKLKEEARRQVEQHTETAATAPPPLMKGFLQVQPVNSMLWKRRYFHLTSTGLQLFKGVASTDNILAMYPLPRRLPEDAFEMCQMAHSIFWECDVADVITVALDSARSRDEFVAVIEVLLEEGEEEEEES